MKKINLIISILCIPLVYSLYGGETAIIFEGECNYLMVNITIDPLQDENEYQLEPNCTMTYQLSENVMVFNCTCQDGRTTLNMTPAVNSMGNYSIVIDYYVTKEVEESHPAAAGGGEGISGGYIGSWLCDDWSECINRTSHSVCYKPRNRNINFTKIKSCFQESELAPSIAGEPGGEPQEEKPVEGEIKEEEKIKEETLEAMEGGFPWAGILLCFLIIIIGLTVYFIWEIKGGKNGKNKSKKYRGGRNEKNRQN